MPDLFDPVCASHLDRSCAGWAEERYRARLGCSCTQQNAVFFLDNKAMFNLLLLVLLCFGTVTNTTLIAGSLMRRLYCKFVYMCAFVELCTFRISLAPVCTGMYVYLGWGGEVEERGLISKVCSRRKR